MNPITLNSLCAVLTFDQFARFSFRNGGYQEELFELVEDHVIQVSGDYECKRVPSDVRAFKGENFFGIYGPKGKVVSNYCQFIVVSLLQCVNVFRPEKGRTSI